ncbi:MAG: hypothetical protein AB7O45_09880 [Alphaproteobacteria bacterium]
MARTVVFTVCAVNYLPRAILLLESLARHEPGMQRRIVLSDRRMALPEVPADVVWADQLDLPNLPAMAFRYQLIELATAVKGFAAARFLAEPDVDRVIFLDPDTRLYAPLSPLTTALDHGAEIALTPHVTEPPERAAFPTHRDLLQVGTYNLGVLGLADRRPVHRFLRWLCRRLEHECVDARAEGVYVDQRFFDLAPSLVDRVAVVRDTGVNVAYWNLDHRRLTLVGQDWMVDGKLLRLFHFSGLDPERPAALAGRVARNPGPALTALAGQYAADLAASPAAGLAGARYGFGRFADGRAVPDPLRYIFRRACEPFAGDPFVDLPGWLEAPADDRPGLTRLMDLVWKHSAEVRRHFPLSDEADLHKYRHAFPEVARRLGVGLQNA